jgi:D-hydroxyproline dehydrogenase subunit beta
VTFDGAVVGGGIVGCACAFYLAQEGRKVAVVEPGPLGGGATAAGMGHLVAMNDSEAQFALTSASLQLWRELRDQFPSSVEFDPAGTLWVASDAEELDAARSKLDYYVRRDVVAELLDEEALREAEPNLREGLAGALFVPGDAVIFPMPAAEWLFARSGAERISSRAGQIGGGWVELEGGQRLEAGMVVNAAGDRAAELTPGLPLQPRKGHLAITDRYPGFVRHQLVELGYLKSAHGVEADSVAFNAQPRRTGQVLLGSSRQFVGHYEPLDRAILGRMLGRATAFLPGLAELKIVRTWAGFRAASPDHLPLIGPWAEEPGLWIASGHEGLGITTSLITGKLLADMACGREPVLDPRPYDPGRLHARSN